MKGFIFLASPYSHPLKEERYARYLAAERACLHYLAKGSPLYSPIVHWHIASDRHKLPHTFDAWQAMNDPILEQARSLHILEIDGWMASKGVQHEISLALDLGKPCYVVSPFRDYSARLLKDALA